jgi:lipopolysaccharide transport system permease protein
MSLPVIAVLNACVKFVIIFGLFLLFLACTGLWPGVVVIAILPVLLIQLLLAVGLGVTLGVLNVFFRDVGQFFVIFLQFWFWLTPVVYPVSILPEHAKKLMSYNPMYPLIHAHQGVFVGGQWPEWTTLIYPMLLGLTLCAAGLYLFRQHAGEIVDEL